MKCHGRPQQVVVHTDPQTQKRHGVCCECLQDHVKDLRQTEFNCPICRAPLDVDEVSAMMRGCVVRYSEIREDRARNMHVYQRSDQIVNQWQQQLQTDGTSGTNSVSSLTEEEKDLIEQQDQGRLGEGTWRGPRTHPETPMAQLRHLTELNRPLNEPTANHRNRKFDLLEDQRSQPPVNPQQHTRYMNILRNTADKLQEWVRRTPTQAYFPETCDGAEEYVHGHRRSPSPPRERHEPTLWWRIVRESGKLRSRCRRPPRGQSHPRGMPGGGPPTNHTHFIPIKRATLSAKSIPF